MIETFFAQYPATISAVSAFATVDAVIVALYLAKKQSRARLKVFSDINIYVPSEWKNNSSGIDLNDAPKMISATINNLCHVAVSTSYWSSFVWSVIGGKRFAIQNPMEPEFQSEPIVLLPGKSASIVLSFDLVAQAETMRNLAATS